MRNINSLISLFMILLLAGMGELYAQNSPVSGTQIKNQATTTFRIDGVSEPYEITSNEVQVVVDIQFTFNLEIENSFKRFRGEKITFSHYLENTGNVGSTFDLNIYNTSDDEFNLEDLAWESFEKSKASSSDTLKRDVYLNPGERLDFSYSGLINRAENDSLMSIIKIEAVSREYGTKATIVDSVYILQGTEIDLFKTQYGADNLGDGDSFTYEISGKNSGDVAALPRSVIIDGVADSKIILLDSIPSNVSFARFVESDKGTKLYGYEGNSKFEFSTQTPTDPSNVNVIALAFNQLEPNESFKTTFEVTVNPGASGTIKNTAEIHYTNPEGNAVSSAASNDVVADLSGGATIDYFTDDTFDKKTGTSSIGKNLFLQANAAACNEFRNKVETVTIRLISEETGDREMFEGVETGPNTSIFRIDGGVPTRDANEFEVTYGNKILETVEDDVIVAILDCEGLKNSPNPENNRIRTNIVVDPYGVVFDSETNKPVSGASITIFDVTGANNGGNAGGIATVYRSNGTTEAPSTVTTSVDGRYRFPYLLPGNYKIEVETPEGYSFVSEVPVGLLPAGRKVDSLASYGKEWQVNNVPVGTTFDIPLDPLAKGVLFTNKKVDRPVAGIGDYINYTVTIKSEAVNTVKNLFIDDVLPFGFEYQLGSAKLDGNKIDDPIGGKGPELKFEVGDISPSTSVDLTYRVYVGPGAEKGDGINVAIAKSDEVIVKSSNQAKVKVEVRGGIFNDDAYIIGKVFQDCNENDVQDAGEVGVPGVRLYLENGTFVITDSEGKYTFYAVKPNKHVLKVDNYSLPKGSKLSVLDNRHANDASSRFVDVKKGELHRADFAICECTPAIHEEIEARKALLAKTGDNALSSSVNRSFALDESSAQSGRGRFDKASGTVGNLNNKTQVAPQNPDGKISEETLNAIDQNNESATYQLEQAILNAAPGLGFLNIANNDTLLNNTQNIWAKGKAGALFNLSLNGELIDASKVGQTSKILNDLQGWEYISIGFKAGKNTLRLEEVDPFGNIRGSEEISIFAPGKAAKVNVTAPVNATNADGVSTVNIIVEIVDENGLLVGDRTPITLDTEFGSWKVKDNNDTEPGTQVFIEGGRAEFELVSTVDPKTTKVRVNLGIIKGETKVEFLPDLRPLIAAGILEGTLRFNEQVNISSTKEEDGFERELRQLSYDFNQFTGDARLAFFIKGKVSGKTLLTAGFDSEKSKEDRLFRDIRPDEFYPVYGESSIKGFDAQSSSRLYVRLDRGKTYVLYGDFITQDRDADTQIGGYSRAQTGVKANLEEGRIKASVFGVNAFSSRKVNEIQGQGISRYDLPDKDIVDNSEIIEIVTYFREQPEVIKNIERLTRFKDYVIDPFSGVITFKSPVSSVDAEFNPIFIRANYEVTNNQDRYLVGGVSAETEVVDGITVGANAVQDNNPDDELTLLSGKINADLGNDTKIVGEFANTTTDSKGSGSAARLEVNHRGKKFDVLAQIGSSDKNFNNQSSSLGQGRTEARTRSRFKLNSTTSVKGEFLFTRNDTTSDQTIGGLLSAEKTFGNNVKTELGLRYSENYMANTDTTSYNTNIRGKLQADFPFLAGASAFGEVEQDLNESEKRLIAVGADYKFKQLAKLYARHEFISSAAGVNTLNRNQQKNNTVFGIDASYMKNGQVYSEYRANDAFDGRSGQAAIGLRNQFRINEGLGLNVGFERVFTVEGKAINDGTAVTSAIDYTGSTKWKGTARAEARFTPSQNTYINSLGYGLKINPDWTFLTKNIISAQTKDGTNGINKLQERLQLGAAYRSTSTNKFDALFRYEFKHEIDENIAPNFYRTAHILSTHANLHPNSDLTITGRVAAKYALESDDQLRTSSFLELISGRAIYDLDDKWDVGINASLLANSDFTTKDYGLGGEVGLIVATNLRLAAGYNVFGYDDQDLVNNNYTRQGVYLGFSYKFDERLIDNLIPNRVKRTPIIDPANYLTCFDICEPDPIIPFEIGIQSIELTPMDLTARSIEFGKLELLTVLPKEIHFNNNSTYINQPAAQMLDKVAKFLLNRDDNYFINVTGHTDSKSSQSYNLDLSQRRAKAVRAYLVASGIDENRLVFEGLSYNKNAVPERDRVDMAKNRRVELNLSVDNRNVRFISQVEDLQVNPSIRGINKWDYVYVAEHHAVPSGLNISGNNLNKVHIYLVSRVALTMRVYPELSVNITAPNPTLATSILSQLVSEGIDDERVEMTINAGIKKVGFEYSIPGLVSIYDQRDDIRLSGNRIAEGMMDNMLNILRTREDLVLVKKLVKSYSVPETVKFARNETKLSNETQAIMSRIGSFMKSSDYVVVQLSGNGSTYANRRISAMRTYLIKWGIDASKIEISNNKSVTSSETITIKYLNADAINLINLDLIKDGVGGGR